MKFRKNLLEIVGYYNPKIPDHIICYATDDNDLEEITLSITGFEEIILSGKCLVIQNMGVRRTFDCLKSEFAKRNYNYIMDYIEKF